MTTSPVSLAYAPSPETPRRDYADADSPSSPTRPANRPRGHRRPLQGSSGGPPRVLQGSELVPRPGRASLAEAEHGSCLPGLQRARNQADDWSQSYPGSCAGTHAMERQSPIYAPEPAARYAIPAGDHNACAPTRKRAAPKACAGGSNYGSGSAPILPAQPETATPPM